MHHTSLLISILKLFIKSLFYKYTKKEGTLQYPFLLLFRLLFTLRKILHQLSQNYTERYHTHCRRGCSCYLQSCSCYCTYFLIHASTLLFHIYLTVPIIYVTPTFNIAYSVTCVFLNPMHIGINPSNNTIPTIPRIIPSNIIPSNAIIMLIPAPKTSAAIIP